jgi:hypothetical protein
MDTTDSAPQGTYFETHIRNTRPKKTGDMKEYRKRYRAEHKDVMNNYAKAYYHKHHNDLTPEDIETLGPMAIGYAKLRREWNAVLREAPDQEHAKRILLELLAR